MTQRPSASSDPELVHASTRTMLSTNRDPAGMKPARVILRMTRMEIRVVEGVPFVRFSGTDIDVTPRGTRPGRPRHRS